MLNPGHPKTDRVPAGRANQPHPRGAFGARALAAPTSGTDHARRWGVGKMQLASFFNNAESVPVLWHVTVTQRRLSTAKPAEQFAWEEWRH